MSDYDFVEQYKELTEILSEYGWAISTYIINNDFQKVYKLAIEIKKKEHLITGEKLKELDDLLTDIIFHPLFRAFFVYRSKEVSHINEYSHHIERAILHYYKNDYFSTVLCLLPAIEGSLLSYFGWKYGNGRKPNIDKLILEIEKCRSGKKDIYYEMYSKSISVFLRKWIFSDTSVADTTYSFLNRHYVLHGMGVENYYSISDANRLIMFFDLFIEFLSIEEDKNYIFIPENNIKINERRDYYFKFIEENIRRDEILETERKLLSENKNYFLEVNIPNWGEMLFRSAKEYLDFIKDLDFKFGNGKSVG